MKFLNRFYAGVGLGLICLLMACTKNNVYEKNQDVVNNKWSWNDKKAFQVNITDTTTMYNLYVNVRHAGTYMYSNLWVKIHTRFPDGSSFDKRVELPLADKDGKWYGEGISDIYDVQVSLQQNMYFSKQGTYTFELEQNMRQNPLPGIMSMGLKLENTYHKRTR